jgi:hypothetical protein
MEDRRCCRSVKGAAAVQQRMQPVMLYATAVIECSLHMFKTQAASQRRGENLLPVDTVGVVVCRFASPRCLEWLLVIGAHGHKEMVELGPVFAYLRQVGCSGSPTQGEGGSGLMRVGAHQKCVGVYAKVYPLAVNHESYRCRHTGMR